MAVINAQQYGDTVIEIARTLYGQVFHPIDATPAATGGTTATLIDTKYTDSIFRDDHFNNWEIGVYSKWVTLVTDFTKSTGTWNFATQASAPVSGDKYWVLNRAGWSTAKIKAAIKLSVEEGGRLRTLAPKVSQALALQHNRSLYPIPSGFSYIHRVYVDYRKNYLARHPSGKWDTLTKLKSAATTNVKLAQSFKVKASNPSFQLGDVYLLLAKLGAPTGNLTLTVESNNSSGFPDGTALATSATVDVTTLTVEPTYTRFTFAAQPVLTDDTIYWLVLSTTTAASSTVCALWANDSVEADYGDGSAATHNDTAYSALTGDFIFSVRGTYPRLELMENRRHVEVIRDTTRYLRLTPAGLNWLDMHGHDGAVIHLEGQGAPALPSADADVLEVPYGFVLAHACLNLISDNPKYWNTNPGSSVKPRFWETQLRMIGETMPTQIMPGSMVVEVM